MDTSQQLLSSWKEISQYLNRGVRTVQRWERELGLPVRRPRGKSRSAVVAMRSELDHWLQACPISKYADEAAGRHPQGGSEGQRFLLATTEFGLTLTGLACAFQSTAKIENTITKARSAYQIVLKFRDRMTLNEPERAKLDSRLEELRSALRGLGQPL